MAYQAKIKGKDVYIVASKNAYILAKEVGLNPIPADDLNVKEAKMVIDEFIAPNDFWEPGTLNSMMTEEIPTLEITCDKYNFDAINFLKFLIMVGESGLYWKHDYFKLSVTIAGKTKDEIEFYKRELDEQLRLNGHK